MSDRKKGFSTFQIAKACGISRATILRLEDEGFITPSHVDSASGKRFYSFSDVARIIQILTLRSFGLEKDIIHSFFDGQEDYQICIDVLQEHVDRLNRIIRVVKNWQQTSDDSRTSFRRISSSHCYCKERPPSQSDVPFFTFLTETFEEAVRLGYEINIAKTPFVQVLLDGTRTVSLRACIPVRERNSPVIKLIPAGQGLIVQWRGNISDTELMKTELQQRLLEAGRQEAREVHIHLPYDEFTRKNVENEIKVVKFIFPE